MGERLTIFSFFVKSNFLFHLKGSAKMKRAIQLILSTLIFSSFSGTVLAKTKSRKNFRIKFNPFAAMTRSRFEGAFDIKVAKRLSIGGTGYYSQPIRFTGITGNTSFKAKGFSRPAGDLILQTKGWGIGAVANLALGREILKDGWTLRLTGSYNKAEKEFTITDDEDWSLGGDGYFSFETLFCYEWVYDFGLNINMGVGLIKKTHRDALPISPSGELSLGFAV